MAVLPAECGGQDGFAAIFDNGEYIASRFSARPHTKPFCSDVRLQPGQLTHLMGTIIIASGALSHLLPTEGAAMNPVDVSSVAIGGSTPALGAQGGGAAGPSPSAAALDEYDAAVEAMLQSSLARIMVLRPRDSVQWIAMLRDCVSWAGEPLPAFYAPQSTGSSALRTPKLPFMGTKCVPGTLSSSGSAAGVCFDLLSSLTPPSAGGATPTEPSAGEAAAAAAESKGSGTAAAAHTTASPRAFDWSAVTLVAIDSIGTFRHHDKYRMPAKGIPLMNQVLTYLRSLQATTGCTIMYSKPVLYSRGQRAAAGSAAGVAPSEAVPAPAADFAKRTEEWLPRDWAEKHVTHRIKCRSTDILGPSAVRLPQAGSSSSSSSSSGGARGQAAVSAVGCFIREAHLVKPYITQEQSTPDAALPRVQAFVYTEAGPIVSLSAEDTALAATEQATMPSVEQALQPLYTSDASP